MDKLILRICLFKQELLSSLLAFGYGTMMCHETVDGYTTLIIKEKPKVSGLWGSNPDIDWGFALMEFKEAWVLPLVVKVGRGASARCYATWLNPKEVVGTAMRSFKRLADQEIIPFFLFDNGNGMRHLAVEENRSQELVEVALRMVETFGGWTEKQFDLEKEKACKAFLPEMLWQLSY